MKIYFAGSIRGGRDDKELYLEIITLLKEYGEVLTEHLGNTDLSHNGEMKTAEFVHQRDVEWIKQCDVVVAEVSTPSLGVGYELGIAESLNKKVLCLYRSKSEKLLSFMIQGNTAFEVQDYSDINDLKEFFNYYFK